MEDREPIGPLTFEEFLAIEQASPIKHELVAGYMYEWNGGEILGLAGATRRHNRIAGNIFAHLWNAADGGPCEVFGSDMLLRINPATTYYPDIQVICDPIDAEEQFTSRPCLIV